MVEEKQKKRGKKKWDFPIGIEPMSHEEASAEMERFFASLEEQYRNVPEEEIARGAKKIRDFMDGKMSWAELFNFTPEMLFQMAEFGFTQFKVGRYADAERVFKVLTVLDWNNAYYHSVMGSVLQRQRRYGEAIAEYSQALELDARDLTSLTNRGEICLQHGLITEAREDFEKAITLDPEGNDRFANRSRMLLKQLERLHSQQDSESENKKGQKGKKEIRQRKE